MLEASFVEVHIVNETFRVGERDVHSALRLIRTGMVEDVMARLRAGKFTNRNLDGQRRSTHKGSRAARASLSKVFRAIGNFGFDHVRMELDKQGEVS